MPLHLARSMVPLATALAVMSGCLLSASAASAAVGGADAAKAAADSMQAAGDPDLAAEWWLAALGVPQAWSALTVAGSHAREGTGVTVAVLSTGVDATQPDLAGDVITGPDYSHSGVSPGDLSWGREGTAVASLIAAHGHGAGNAEGITGVAPGARILSLRVTLEYNDPRNSNRSVTTRLTSAITAGIRYAVSHGASVIALPLDPGTLGMLASGDPAAAGGSAAEQAAVRAALADNVVLVAPAGDNAMGTGAVNYPAAYTGVIAVGATDRSGRLESFSSRRSFVSLTAPGGGMTVAAPGGYDAISTTDMSAALVAGVAALIRARYPGLSAAQVAEAIEKGTTSQPGGTAGSAGAGAGALNAAQALRKAASLAANLPQPVDTAAGKPSAAGIAPAALAASTGSGAGNPGLGNTAASVLHYAAIVIGTLIVALATLLLLAEIRRRRRSATRERERARASRTATGRRAADNPTTGRPAIRRPTPDRPAIGAPRAIGGPSSIGGPALAPAPSAVAHSSPSAVAHSSAVPGPSATPGPSQVPRPSAVPPESAVPRPSEIPRQSGAPRTSAVPRRQSAAPREWAAAWRRAAAAVRTRPAGEAARRPEGRLRTASKPRTAPGRAVASLPRKARARRTHGTPTRGRRSHQHRIPPPVPPRPLPAGTPKRRSRSSRIAQTGSVGSMGLPAPQPGRPDDAPPWAPAQMPAGATPPLTAVPTPDLAAPIAPILPQPAPTEARPPWEQDRDALAQEPEDTGFPAHSTGPMYIWNPATNSSPFPAVADED